MKAAPLAAALLLLAAGARAQSYGRDTPWTGDENMAEASTLPSGTVRNAVPLRIRTSRPACLLPTGFPVIRALIDPAESVESARLLFRPLGYPRWYELPMRRSGPGFLAVLPRPRPSAGRVEYVVDATAPGHPHGRGPQLSVPVVEEAARCGGPPAEAMESAAIAVRVPRGAPAVPPVPPGFAPVGAVALDSGGGPKASLPLAVAGGFAAAAAGVLLVPRTGEGVPSQQPSPDTTVELAFLDSTPPPDSHISIGASRAFTVRMRARAARAVGPGRLTVTLYRLEGGPGVPCAVLVAPHGGFPASRAAELVASGSFQTARVCQPADRMRLTVEENAAIVLGTGTAERPDAITRYFLDP